MHAIVEAKPVTVWNLDHLFWLRAGDDPPSP